MSKNRFWKKTFDLYYYGARWYDPALGQFLSPDTIVPAAGNALDYHRYAYTRFNPVKYTDPTGHQAACMMGTDGSLSCSDNTTVGGATLTIDMKIPAAPQPLLLPVSSAAVKPPHMSAPTPTQAPSFVTAPSTPPTVAPSPPGAINQSDLYWSGAMALVDDIPESMGRSGIVRAAGRGIGQFIPAIGYGASVGPNLGRHLLAQDPIEEVIADFATDTFGFGASASGGKGIGLASGALVAIAGAPQAFPVAKGLGEVVGGVAVSVAWDTYAAPTVSQRIANWLQTLHRDVDIRD